MRQYLALLEDVLQNGIIKDDRTGTGTISTFGQSLRIDLTKGFPLLTTKKLHIKSIIYELLWFLDGNTNNKYLTDNEIFIWKAWADENGDLGNIYGYQWRTWHTPDGKVVDQISNLIEQIKNNPDSRRHLVSAWNVGELHLMNLPPCHYAFQFYVANGKLSCLFNMRSTDCFLGLPYNLASYAFLTHMIAQQCDLEVGELIYNGGDVHIYLNHKEQVDMQLTRNTKKLPTLKLNKKDSIFDYKFEDFTIENYDAHPTIKAKVAI